MTAQDFQTQRETSYLEGDNVSYIEGLYEAYLQDPNSVSDAWREYFHGMADDGKERDVSLSALREEFLALAKSPRRASVAASVAASDDVQKELGVFALIQAYRQHGHLKANLDPLNLQTVPSHPDLALQAHGLNDADLQKEFYAVSQLNCQGNTLHDALTFLEKTYCHHIAYDYAYMSNGEERQWLQNEIENKPHVFSVDEKKQMLAKLVAADGLEKYLSLKYVGQKRFSLEGGDAFIPMLDQLARDAVESDIEDCVIGMAHRGRLNVLVNIIGKSSQLLFDEFEGKNVESDKTGDVKYHMGFSSDVIIDNKPLHLSLAFNPSHLEIVSPVIMGAVRAKQFRSQDKARAKKLAIMVHGDSAVAGQGVVFETISMSQVTGFTVGGSIHIVINNQVGFTTSKPEDTRSSIYCSDVAKTVDMPSFHVNGDDPEAVCRVMKLALAYRNQFKKDVMIDLICYRRLGHNEADDPSITQPDMYAVIKKHPVPAKIYADQLQRECVIGATDYKTMQQAYKKLLDRGGAAVETKAQKITQSIIQNWQDHLDQPLDEKIKTAVSKKTLNSLAKALYTVPKDFNIHPQVKKLLTAREKMSKGELSMDWGYAENLAYATLLNEGYHVRLSGEDAGRGTFAHRHAQLHDTKCDKIYTSLSHVSEKQAPFEVINSLLSEEAVLAFEYGYGASDPDYLTLWEAQFGDFANGAQVVIDQFISSGEQKWDRVCALVMLLPHGYEGMGPEHSSARLERYLQLCAQHNMQVCVPSTPAQTFHMLRRQMLRKARKPLIVMTPKSLLRHKLAVSTLDDLSSGQFHLLIPEIDKIPEKKVSRVIVCSGKVYYDLLEKRREHKANHVAILRIEQLYPFPRIELCAELKRYSQAKDIVWCQEEPQNQGAWYQITHNLIACMQKGQNFRYVGREASAAPAVGYAHKHKAEQIALVEKAILE